LKTYLYQCVVNKDCPEKEHPAKALPPMCCGKEMRKIYVPPPIIYKGDGFTGAQKEER